MNNNASSLNIQERDAARGEHAIAFEIRTSVRARRVSLRITPDARVEIVLPQGVRLTDPEAFVAGYAGWIRDRLGRLSRSQPLSLFLQEPLEIMGERLPVRLIVTPGKRPKVVRTVAGIIVYAPDEKPSTRIRILRKWCIGIAKETIPARVFAANRGHGFPFSRVSVRDQKTRWGSCSRRGTLSFNWRLILLPPAVMDYLIFHELAHITHMNHSKSYWRFVETLYPGYREAERWLRKYSKTIVT